MDNELNINFSMPMGAFYVERQFDEKHFFHWIRQNWHLSLYYSAVYVMVIFGGKRYMESRPKFELRLPLAIWSGILAIFSICGMIRTLPELIFILESRGLETSVCSPSYFHGPVGFWCFMFTVSKVYELGDTLFIVLRKQQLIFLHWYHHTTVLIYVWYTYPYHIAPGRWFMVMNFSVHALMYTYYTLRALRFRIPKQINMIITSMQIIQMIMGCAVNIYSYQLLVSGRPCNQSLENLQWSLMMYFSYFVLFGHFFYTTYIVKREPTKEKLK